MHRLIALALLLTPACAPAPPGSAARTVLAEPAPAPPAAPAKDTSPEAKAPPPAEPRGTAADAIALERSPGLTPALPERTFPAAAAAPELAGSPSPSPAMGPDDAPVRVFVFSDFQCPVCRRAVEPLKKLVRDNDPLVQVIFKHLALDMHPRARPAAIASLAAFELGGFWDFHDRLFQASGDLSDAAFETHAAAMGLDPSAFAAARARDRLGAQVDHEIAVGQALGVRGTPGFVINGHVTVGWGSYLGLDHTVQKAIAAYRASGLRPGLETARALTAAEDPAAARLLFPAPSAP